MRLAARQRAFSLIEILVSIGIIAVLATVAGIAYKPLVARAESARCMSNMRSIHTALAAYIQDKSQWPQEPEALWQSGSNDALEDWWFETMRPYGIEIETWRCPTLFRALQKSNPEERPKLHYMPGKFDESPLSPYRWATQPWLIEIGDMHGRGGHICFPDGSIRVLSDFLPPEKKN